MTKSKKNVKPGESLTEVRGDICTLACPTGFKLGYRANPNPIVREWAHVTSLECVRSEGY